MFTNFVLPKTSGVVYDICFSVPIDEAVDRMLKRGDSGTEQEIRERVTQWFHSFRPADVACLRPVIVLKEGVYISDYLELLIHIFESKPRFEDTINQLFVED